MQAAIILFERVRKQDGRDVFQRSRVNAGIIFIPAEEILTLIGLVPTLETFKKEGSTIGDLEGQQFYFADPRSSYVALDRKISLDFDQHTDLTEVESVEDLEEEEE